MVDETMGGENMLKGNKKYDHLQCGGVWKIDVESQSAIKC